MKSPTAPRVLYADGDEEFGLMLSTLLALSNIEVQTAESVADALYLARNKSFDLYLLETRLATGDGFELRRRLRELDGFTPIVFYSADGREEDKAKGLAAGATAYLVKPDFDNIVPSILRLVKAH